MGDQKSWTGVEFDSNAPACGGGPGGFAVPGTLGLSTSKFNPIAIIASAPHPQSPVAKTKVTTAADTAELEKLVAPDLSTDRNALLYCLIVESDPAKGLGDVTRGMNAMHAALANRLRRNYGGQFMAPHAQNIRDILGGKGQFAGFSKKGDELTVVVSLEKRLEEFYKIANNKKDVRHNRMRQFLKAAQDVADGAVDDPFEKSGGTYGWRTAKSGSPGSNFKLLENVAGNEFYTLTADFDKELTRLLDHAKKAKDQAKPQ